MISQFNNDVEKDACDTLTGSGSLLHMFAYENIMFDVTRIPGLLLIAHINAATRGRLSGQNGLKNRSFLCSIPLFNFIFLSFCLNNSQQQTQKIQVDLF